MKKKLLQSEESTRKQMVSFQRALLTGKGKGKGKNLLVLEEEKVTTDMVSTPYDCLQVF